ncbi:DUF1028 domain-containing protein [Ramlibacter sp.]|uniref:DUF1028 domain-containing protein n=1 Tax=Ramlibacter sp. TaxID=1917967 RepID=UPI00262C9D95|nr:DUF1028 domain-containing protein [Ramlibacter sp.]MDB5956491.1 hypothetical protein [Ramlibacter sp.]
MTYSIIARCPRTQRFGIATATFSIACGRRNESIRANLGVSKSQAFYLRQVDVAALNMLAQGHTPEHAMRSFAQSDPDFAYRQFGIIDREGRVAMHSGDKINPWSGHEVGVDFAAYGNTLRGPATLAGIVAGFHASPGAALEERLLQAIEGGRDGGGQASRGETMPERSAWLRVVGQQDWPEVDLRVDLHGDAVGALRRLHSEYRHYAGYYAERDRRPREAVFEEDFVAGL